MKIITWNCNRQFRTKFNEIIKEDADIYVIPECEDPSKSKSEKYKEFAGENYFWTGDKKDQGLGIFAKEDVKLEKIPNLNEDFANFIAVRVNDSFNLLGVWAMPPYVQMIHDYLDANTGLFNKDLIMCGDFNSNSIWDKHHKTLDKFGNEKNHTNLNLKLEKLGLMSAYHNLKKEKQGEESEKTFLLYRHINKPYHIDYIYSEPARISELKILDSYKWLNSSDHLPIAFEIDNNQRTLTSF